VLVAVAVAFVTLTSVLSLLSGLRAHTDRCITRGFSVLFFGSGTCGNQPSNVIPYLNEAHTHCWYDSDLPLSDPIPFPSEDTFRENFSACSNECVQDVTNLMMNKCGSDTVAGKDIDRLLQFVDSGSPVPKIRQLMNLIRDGLGDDDNGCGSNCPVAFNCPT
jgi:hypothetical protein